MKSKVQSKLTRADRMKRTEFTELEQIPNIGRSIAADLRSLGIEKPSELIGRDPFVLYEESNRLAGVRQDPCLADVFISAVRFMEGAPARPWWEYTAERKRALT